MNEHGPHEDNDAAEVLLQLRSVPGHEVFLSRTVQAQPGPRGRPLSLPPQISGFNRGPLRSYIDGEVFVSASIADPARVPQFHELGLGGCFLVGPEVKAFIESFKCERCDFLPASVDLSKRDWNERQAVDKIGGGEIIRDVYHIWDVYNRLDLVDSRRSTSDRAVTKIFRYDLPGQPEQSFTFYSTKGPLFLLDDPHDAHDVYQIVGFDLVMVSPRFAEQVAQKSWLGPKVDDPRRRFIFEPFHLDRVSYEQRMREGSKIVPLRIFGTKTTLNSPFEPPFRIPLRGEI